jgi:hypothetical protein
MVRAARALTIPLRDHEVGYLFAALPGVENHISRVPAVEDPETLRSMVPLPLGIQLPEGALCHAARRGWKMGPGSRMAQEYACLVWYVD